MVNGGKTFGNGEEEGRVLGTMAGDDEALNAAGWRQPVLAVGLIVWLGAFWFSSDATMHRLSLLVLVLPGVVVNWEGLRVVLRRERWVWLVVALLVYQWLSRSWSVAEGEAVPEGYWLDVVLVLILVAGILALAGSDLVGRWLLPALGGIATLGSLYSLLVYYSDPERSVAEDRLRHMLVYDHGLNPVLSGLLFSFGALVVIGQTTREGRMHWVWLVALVVVLLGMLATQSRGAILATGFGGVMFLWWERRKVLPAVVTSGATTLGFFAVLFWVQSGTEAAKDLIGRGATGRFQIYEWYLKQMSGWDGVFGKGMERASTIPEEEFGWFIEHPHSIYMTQFFLTGLIGTGMMLMILLLGLQAAWRLARGGEVLWLALLGGFCVALFFDGSHVFSVFSSGRIEPLLLVFPAVMAVGRRSRVEGPRSQV